jgi:quercetin 2,3-dioxygenase
MGQIDEGAHHCKSIKALSSFYRQVNNSIMTNNRKLIQVYTPAAQPGFLGKGHMARPVIQIDFSQSDPFIMLMDDMLDKKDDIPVGGPHPHAGFETVSLLLEGEIGEEPHLMKAGDFEIMTAGSGIVHTETITKQTKMRLLQLWLNLPKHERHATPRTQKLKSEHVPVSSVNGTRIRLYSGSLGELSSPVRNYTPVTIADVAMEARAVTHQILPSRFTTFLYVIEGSVHVGEEEKLLIKDQVGWLDVNNDPSNSELILKAGDNGIRFVLYSAEPQRHPIVSHGPFIADTMEDIRQLYADFRAGKMGHITEVGEEHKMVF